MVIGRGVSTISYFVVGSTVDVVKDWARKTFFASSRKRAVLWQSFSRIWWFLSALPVP
jgi:hypothetical protein